MAGLMVSLEHLPVALHNGFAKLMDDELGFFVAEPRCSGISLALSRSCFVSFCLLFVREGVTQRLSTVRLLLCK